ncbi:MAG: S-methyl-5-thioribose-1-phosphate isomerase [bacterium]
MKVEGQSFRSIWYEKESDKIQIIDQTCLPYDFKIVTLSNLSEAAQAIQSMQVRGAPLIGVTAAFGVYLGLSADASDFGLEKTVQTLIETRPTAVNLHWALQQLKQKVLPLEPELRAKAALNSALAMAEEDVEINYAIGQHALKVIQKKASKKPGKTIHILTHCNAGWLATVDWGTALSGMYQAHEAGIDIHVYVDETRPRNQGTLSAWELSQHGIKNTVITDNAGGILMQKGEVDLVIVGTDRTTSNGDVCNKIGTYLKALAAADNNVPFYVALPGPTIDWSLNDGADIPIEQRSDDEIRIVQGLYNGKLSSVQIYPDHVAVGNPAFDVTPARLVSGLITERGVCEPDKLNTLYPEHAS